LIYDFCHEKYHEENTNIVTVYATEMYVFYILLLSTGMLRYYVYYIPIEGI